MSTTTQPVPTQPANGQPAALARIDPKTVCAVPQLRTLLSAQLPDLQRLYPAALQQAAPRLARAIVTEVQKNPQLAKCTAASLISCAVQAAQLQLEIGGPLGQSYMVPYWSKDLNAFEAQFQLGYRGMVTLACRSGKVRNVTAQLVREGDEFDVVLGTAPGIHHRPGKARGATTHAYAVVQYAAGGVDVEVMTVAEIDEHRKRYSKQGTAKNGDRAGVWQSSFDAMALKTPLRKLLKRCPVGVDIDAADPLPPADPAEAPAALPPREEPRRLPPAEDLEALAARKGVSPADAAEWLDREFGGQDGAAYDDLPPYADLPEAERRALAEWLAGLPDAA